MFTMDMTDKIDNDLLIDLTEEVVPNKQSNKSNTSPKSKPSLTEIMKKSQKKIDKTVGKKKEGQKKIDKKKESQKKTNENVPKQKSVITQMVTTSNSVQVPTTSNSVQVPTTSNSVQMPTTSNSVQMPTTSNSVQMPTTSNSFQIPDFSYLTKPVTQFELSRNNHSHKNVMNVRNERARKEKEQFENRVNNHVENKHFNWKPIKLEKKFVTDSYKGVTVDLTNEAPVVIVNGTTKKIVFEYYFKYFPNDKYTELAKNYYSTSNYTQMSKKKFQAISEYIESHGNMCNPLDIAYIHKILVSSDFFVVATVENTSIVVAILCSEKGRIGHMTLKLLCNNRLYNLQKGVGGILLRNYIDLLTKSGFTKINLETSSNKLITYYKNFGFEQSDSDYYRMSIELKKPKEKKEKNKK